MDKLKSFFSSNLLLLLGVLISVFGLLSLIKSFFPRIGDRVNNTTKSDDSSVNKAINILDDALGTFGTLNSSHKYIFGEIQSLSRSQVYKLHRDFGTRFYIRATRSYEIVNLSPFIQSKELNLTQIYRNELDDVQLSRLKNIYEAKAVRGLL